MKYLIIGGVAGGATVAARLRRLDEQAEIILVERGKYVSYANCGLPYYIGGTIDDRQKLFVQTAQGFTDRFRIDIRTEQEVIAVGTTSCRTLEAVWAKYGRIVPCSGNTDIFLYPGVELHAIDALVTNFHLPESTLIMLIAAFYGYDKTMAAYREAVAQRYRFFSFGDAMLIR